MENQDIEKRFAICIDNQDYPASLEIRKIYQVLSDDAATALRLIRVVDESGEDYLYPADYFVAIDLPDAAVKAFLLVA